MIPFGLGKFHMVWETDKVTKGQVRVVDSDGNVVGNFADAKEYAYDHTADLEGLDPAAVYKIVVIARDPNQNENSDSVQTEALSGIKSKPAPNGRFVAPNGISTAPRGA